MAKYEVERACGHTETISLFGKVKDREWRLENIESQKLCYDCWQKQLKEQREKENQEAAEVAKEMNLPQLTGTENQIAWAVTIRQKILSGIDEYIFTRMDKELRNDPRIWQAVEYLKNNKTEARWWIDNRGMGDSYKIRLMIEKAAKDAIDAEIDPPPGVISEVKIEATVRPEDPKTETVAEIRAVDNFIEIDFPEKRDDFRKIVKEKLNMRWNGRCWSRKITFQSGVSSNRAIEAGHVLLHAGFPIRIYDKQIRQRSITGDYEPEITRWIMARVKGEYTGWFVISWGRDEDFYKVSRRITGSKYSRPSVVVPPEQFEQVLDFASLYDFKLSPGAIKVVDNARAIKESTLVVKVKAQETPEKVSPDNTPPTLEVPEGVGIDETLQDHD